MNRTAPSVSYNPPAGYRATPIQVAIFLIFCSTLVGWLHPYIVFPFYIISAAIGFNYNRNIPILFIIKLIIAAPILIYHIGSSGSILNIASLLVADMYAFTIGMALFRMPLEKSILAMYRLGVWCFWGTFLVSMFGSYVFGLLNPIHDFINGNRVLFLATPGIGHSILGGISALSLICILSTGLNISKFIASVAFSTLLFSGGSATNALCVFAIWAVYFFEKSGLPNKFKSTVYVASIAVSAIFLISPENINSAMKTFRIEIVGQQEDSYSGDFSAGRLLLNELLIETTNQNPFFGVGHDHPSLLYGLRIITGRESGAASESPLRLSAKYGWPFFLISAIIFMMPLFYGLIAQKRISRMFFIMSGVSVFIMGSTNADISLAQSATYILFSPIAWMSWYALVRKFTSEASRIVT